MINTHYLELPLSRNIFMVPMLFKPLKFYCTFPLLQIWLVIFPEGTRYNPELPGVIEKSKQYTKEQGKTIQPS